MKTNLQPVRKAVIPAAGLGTRFLPATKAMPKEMLPIVDKPTIQYIIEEAVEAGIEDIIIVTGRGKRAIEDHFDRTVELEELLESKQKLEQLEEIRSISKLANIHYTRQAQPLGLGHAIWCARRFVGNEPFAVLLGDDIVRGGAPSLRDMMELAQESQRSVIGVKNVPLEDVSRYGIVDCDPSESNVVQIRDLIEKPAPSSAPSTLAIIGRYVLTPEIFEFLDKQQIGVGGEIQLTDALVGLNQQQPMYAYRYGGQRFDVGEKLGFIEAILEFALMKPNLRDSVLNLLEGIIEGARSTQ
ncbi:UTP--glucose-1-phosphate uridylyltransferase GalU [Alicyclobacillus fastidiosus]|uniref:UTP--glucose-1-phosphate uridylyltransferase n=1 Tax=Alicyclobacillus fastidiosus TaxID=392011 RepID=A0ABY6ZJU3_9BACL|nr:UTP--glucose-1-phosphate uridylyltransferase GalU [Alicyclobacillus fastidiosus]WAH43122.1 UTP--glucose-1-phosphate uridylyltransferase GalU [Alicyclobacillus fastidiosus]GMA65127.1 UTP--glucose-1-phosphate uridylyltransferase [Alicyclobacillus fastidiosus]